MRHRVKGRKLNRTASHRLATMRSLATALFLHKKIKTTVAKAKAARLFVEPLITKAKNGSLHAHRLVARHISDRDAMKELFGTIAEKVSDRPGGYTRVVKLGQRHGDGAEMAILELVDFGETGSNRTKKKSKKKVEKVVEEKVVVKEEEIEDAEIVEETVTEENSNEEVHAEIKESTEETEEQEVDEAAVEENKVEEKKADESSAEEKKAEDK